MNGLSPGEGKDEIHAGKIADSATHGGWLVGLLLGAINYFSPSEWMVIGIFVGILSSVIGCVVGIWFRCRRERLLKMYLIDRSHKNISARDVDLIGASSGFGKTKLSAAMLALIAAGASAPVMMAQFQDEKKASA